MRTLRELRAMALLVLRSWYRMGPRLRGGRKPEPTRGVSAVLMRLVFVALMYNFGFTSSLNIPDQPEPVWSATWAGLGMGFFALGMSFALELPSPRMPTQALKSELLELLPLSRLSKLFLLLAQAFMGLPLTLGLVLSLRSQTAPESPLLGALLLALALFVAFALAGACLGRVTKLVFSAYRASRLSWLSIVPMVAGILLLRLAPVVKSMPKPPLLDGLGRAMLGQDVWRAVTILSVSALLFGGSFAWLERGQELSQPIRPGPTASAFSHGMNLRLLERVLTRREPGGSFQAPFAALFCTAFVGWGAWKLQAQVPNSRFLWNLMAIIVLQMVTTMGMQRANRGAARDMLARPLLGCLPISPSETLASKANTLRISGTSSHVPSRRVLPTP